MFGFMSAWEFDVTCTLCMAMNEDVLVETEKWRVIVVHDEIKTPAFCRVIWREHIAEMTDLSIVDRDELMRAVYLVEAAMREVLQPSKINLASLGNVVPHLHWHIIARFVDDACFPAPIWTQAIRKASYQLPENWIQQVQQKILMAVQAA